MQLRESGAGLSSWREFNGFTVIEGVTGGRGNVLKQRLSILNKAIVICSLMSYTEHEAIIPNTVHIILIQCTLF